MRSQRFLIGSDMLWALVILAGFLFFTSLIPLPPNDYWWHLRIGEAITDGQGIPVSNQYSWSVSPDKPFFYAAWFSEVLLYFFHRAGGLELNIFMRNLLAALAFWLVGVEARRCSGSWRIAALMLAFVCLMSTNNLIVRPQMFAWLPFVVIYLSLSRFTNDHASHKLLLLCPIMIILWVNLHGSFVIGLGMIVIYLLGEYLRFLLKQEGSLSNSQLGWLAAATGASFLAVLVNPRFIAIVAYIKNLLTSQPVQQLIEEWQPPTPHGLANMVFFGSILVLLVGLAISRARLTPSEILLMLAFLWLAWGSQRSVTWYGMIVMPLLGKILTALPFRTPSMPVQRNLINNVLVVLLFIPVIMVQPWLVDQFPLPDTYQSQIKNDPEIGPLLSLHTPVGAARYITQHPGGQLFNELGYGSYLIWAAPNQPVYIDPRIELYPQEIWDDYIHISDGIDVTFLLEKYTIDRIMLDRDIQPELSRHLQSDPAWYLEYSDQTTQLWRSANYNATR